MPLDRQALLREIPKVDIVLTAPCFVGLDSPALTESVRCVLEDVRAAVLEGSRVTPPDLEEIRALALEEFHRSNRYSLRPVINGTGIVLHTNLGRACLSQTVAEAVKSVAMGYSTVEYDPIKGERGSRHTHVESLLCRLTGAEAAMAVNNNAAAVLLALSALTPGREVILSRGELVEIGGSFRVPDVMIQSGALLREVGTTNKTYPADYINAIGPETGALLKVHTSNYRIVGFAQEVSLAQLAEIGQEYGLPVLHDLGSGLLFPPEILGVADEPYAAQSVSAGASLVAFSGDKLLGGPQAGIIVGKQEYIQLLRQHPLARALRIDKLNLAALEATLRICLDPQDAMKRIPVLAMLCAKPEELLAKANRLCDAIGFLKGCDVEVIEDSAQVGGGSMPLRLLPSYGVSLTPKAMSVDRLQASLNQLPTPIVGHIHRQRYLLNVRTLFEPEFCQIASALKTLFSQSLF